MSSIEDVGKGKPVGQRVEDDGGISTFYRDERDKVKILVIKDPMGNITGGYPTGGTDDVPKDFTCI